MDLFPDRSYGQHLGNKADYRHPVAGWNKIRV